jgi:hypothetical protein
VGRTCATNETNYRQLEGQVGPQNSGCRPDLAVIFVNCKDVSYFREHHDKLAHDIKTAGDVCKLDLSIVETLPISTPKISHARRILKVSRNSDFYVCM